MSTDITVAAEVTDPLAHLPAAIRNRVLAARTSILNSASITTKKIGVKQGGGAYKFPDDSTSPSFTGIIIAVKHANKNYPKAYVAGKPEPADCVAVGLTGDPKNEDLLPLEEVSGHYATNCKVCPRYQWGSNPAGTGRGKLCTEFTLMAVYIPSLGDDLYLVEEKKARSQQIDSHLRMLTNRLGHYGMAFTQFTIGEAGAFDQTFVATDPVPEELFAKLCGRMDEAEEMLVASVKNSLGSSDEAMPESKDEAGTPVRAARKR